MFLLTICEAGSVTFLWTTGSGTYTWYSCERYWIYLHVSSRFVQCHPCAVHLRSNWSPLVWHHCKWSQREWCKQKCFPQSDFVILFWIRTDLWRWGQKDSSDNSGDLNVNAMFQINANECDNHNCMVLVFLPHMEACEVLAKFNDVDLWWPFSATNLKTMINWKSGKMWNKSEINVKKMCFKNACLKNVKKYISKMWKMWKEIVEKLDICKSFWNRKRLKNAQSIEHVVNDIKLLWTTACTWYVNWVQGE